MLEGVFWQKLDCGTVSSSLMKRLHKPAKCLTELAVRLMKLLYRKYPMAIIDLGFGALSIVQIQTKIS